MKTPDGEWLTLTEASTLLGIHPITLRSWADAGLLRLFRTPGGHRRFRRTELLEFMETKNAEQQPREVTTTSDQTLLEIRREMGAHPVRTMVWFTRLSHEQRMMHRELGQRLLGLLLQHVSHREGAYEFQEQGCEIARLYGKEAAHAQFGSGELANAFLFFRRTIIGATFSFSSGRAHADADGLRLLGRINAFMDELLLAALNEYDRTMESAPVLQPVVPRASYKTAKQIDAPSKPAKAAKPPVKRKPR